MPKLMNVIARVHVRVDVDIRQTNGQKVVLFYLVMLMQTHTRVICSLK